MSVALRPRVPLARSFSPLWRNAFATSSPGVQHRSFSCRAAREAGSLPWSGAPSPSLASPTLHPPPLRRRARARLRLAVVRRQLQSCDPPLVISCLLGRRLLAARGPVKPRSGAWVCSHFVRVRFPRRCRRVSCGSGDGSAGTRRRRTAGPRHPGAGRPERRALPRGQRGHRGGRHEVTTYSSRFRSSASARTETAGSCSCSRWTSTRRSGGTREHFLNAPGHVRAARVLAEVVDDRGRYRSSRRRATRGTWWRNSTRGEVAVE